MTRRSPSSPPGRTRTRRTYTPACAGFSPRRPGRRSRRGMRIDRRPMNRYGLTAMLLAGLLTRSARAAEPDAAAIARLTGLQPDVKNGVAKISAPRSDLTVTVDGV